MDRDKFSEWWITVRADVLRLLRHYTAPLGSDIASDLEQNVALLAWKSRTEFSDVEHFRAWVLNCAKWRAIDELRLNKKICRAFSEIEAKKTNHSIENQEGSLLLHEMLRATNQLPTQQRKVIQGMLQGKSDNKLAEELKVDPRTIRSLRRFGRAKLLAIQEG